MQMPRLQWYHVLLGLALLTLAAWLVAPGQEFSSRFDPSSGSVGIVELNGAIAYGNGIGSSGISPESVDSLTQQALDDGADAIIYEINSGGGAVVASRQAAQVVERVEVPTVCRIKEVGASGAYWVASACDRVVADPLSLTGSIGVTAAYLQFAGLLDKLGITYVNLTSGDYKDMGSQFANLSDEEQRQFQHILDTTHDRFVDSIARNRNMSEEDVRASATGAIFLGVDAKERGLVDELGGHQAAIDLAKNMTNLSTVRERSYRPSPRFNLLSLLATSIGEGIASGLKDLGRPGIAARLPSR